MEDRDNGYEDAKPMSPAAMKEWMAEREQVGREMDELLEEAEKHLEESGRIIDSLKRELAI